MFFFLLPRSRDTTNNKQLKQLNNCKCKCWHHTNNPRPPPPPFLPSHGKQILMRPPSTSIFMVRRELRHMRHTDRARQQKSEGWQPWESLNFSQHKIKLSPERQRERAHPVWTHPLYKLSVKLKIDRLMLKRKRTRGGEGGSRGNIACHTNKYLKSARGTHSV